MVNLGWLGIGPFDSYPFGLLTRAGSLEAILLSTFVLISQNRMTEVASKRAELDLQVNMLTKHELTQMIRNGVGQADHLGIEDLSHARLEEAMQDINPVQVAEIMEQGREAPGERGRAPFRAAEPPLLHESGGWISLFPVLLAGGRCW
ncbi:DUF1003 domain-containing protein [Deinococcus navajonensis]|uniref:DUF1003 domain-containing protein n=1 Tax=Deinococcus navajonensis TaxID=309884 RepID=A0ABV8XSF3_9DEIO